MPMNPSDSASSLNPEQESAPNLEMVQSPVPPENAPSATPLAPNEPPPSFVKLAMRNMVKKGGKSLFHFTLTTVGLLGLLVGLAYLTR